MVLLELARENYPANEWDLKRKGEKKKTLEENSNYIVLKITRVSVRRRLAFHEKP